MQSLHDSSMKGQRLINQLISASMSQKEETNSTLQHLYDIGKEDTNQRVYGPSSVLTQITSEDEA